MSYFRRLWPILFTAIPCLAQSWEIGAEGGFSFYHDATISNAGSSANAGFGSRIAASGLIGEDVGQYFGGELRYTYLDGDSRLSAGGETVRLNGAAHAVHYEFLAYATPKHSRLRPFVTAGAGIKRYTATGAQYQQILNAEPPLGNFALLAHTDEVEALVTFGGGLKIKLNDHCDVRLDFRDYLTPFPEDLFITPKGATIHGWLNDFVPMAGIDWTFGKP